MNKHAILFSMLFVLLAAIAFAQDSAVSPSLKARVERGLQQSDLQTFLNASRKGPEEASEVGSAIIAAGNTNDVFWVPYLKPFLKNWHDRNPNLSELSGIAQLALAKLGEKEQLQEIACEANFGSSSIQYNAVTNKLKYVQGWFSISILTEWTEENHKFKGLLLDQPGDTVYIRPQDLALKMLPKIVPNPPLSAPLPIWMETTLYNDKLASLRLGWREWIHQNEDSLRKLTPTSEGMDQPEGTCKRVLAHDKHFDRSGLQ